MNYQETLDFIYAKTPSLDRQGWGAYKPGLERIVKQMDLLGNPHQGLKVIHVAGTNGKGSVCSLLASVLQEAGHKVGLFTSPHLIDFRERIRVGGESITEVEVVSFVSQFTSLTNEVSPSFFEYTFAMAMWYFKEMNVDVAVIETGLGGRLDCTNVVDPLVSVITSIGMDHQQFLGNTLEQIAKEKGGIIKEQTPVVVGVQQSEVKNVLKGIAADLSAQYHEVSSAMYEVEEGSVQGKNNAIVKEVFRVLSGINRRWEVDEKTFKQGKDNLLKNTGLRGRYEIWVESPKVILDVAHNEDGVRALMKRIQQELKSSESKLHVVWGMSSDKDVESVFALLREDAIYYWCKSNHGRAMEAENLQRLGDKFALKSKQCNSVQSAYKDALYSVKDKDVILVGGSVFVVAEFLSSEQT